MRNKKEQKEKLIIFSIVLTLAVALVFTLQLTGTINLFSTSVGIEDYKYTEYFPHGINQNGFLSIVGIDFLHDINSCNYEEGIIQKVFPISAESEAPFLYNSGGQYTLDPEYYGSDGSAYLYTWYGKSDSCGSENQNTLTNPKIIIQGVANVGETIILPSTNFQCSYFRVDSLSCQTKPQCFDEMAKCEGTSSFICSTDETWNNQGVINGKCGVGSSEDTNQTDDETGDQIIEDKKSSIPIIFGILLFVILVVILFSIGGKKNGR